MSQKAKNIQFKKKKNLRRPSGEFSAQKFRSVLGVWTYKRMQKM